MLSNLYIHLYFFSRFTENRFTPEEIRIPHFMALNYSIILILFNIITIDLLVLSYADVRLFTGEVIYISIATLYLVGYMKFLFKKKYERLYSTYLTRSKSYRYISKLKVVIYISVTIITFIIGLIIL